MRTKISLPFSDLLWFMRNPPVFTVLLFFSISLMSIISIKWANCVPCVNTWNLWTRQLHSSFPLPLLVEDIWINIDLERSCQCLWLTVLGIRYLASCITPSHPSMVLKSKHNSMLKKVTGLRNEWYSLYIKNLAELVTLLVPNFVLP